MIGRTLALVGILLTFVSYSPAKANNPVKLTPEMKIALKKAEDKAAEYLLYAMVFSNYIPDIQQDAHDEAYSSWVGTRAGRWGLVAGSAAWIVWKRALVKQVWKATISSGRGLDTAPFALYKTSWGKFAIFAGVLVGTSASSGWGSSTSLQSYSFNYEDELQYDFLRDLVDYEDHIDAGIDQALNSAKSLFPLEPIQQIQFKDAVANKVKLSQNQYGYDPSIPPNIDYIGILGDIYLQGVGSDARLIDEARALEEMLREAEFFRQDSTGAISGDRGTNAFKRFEANKTIIETARDIFAKAKDSGQLNTKDRGLADAKYEDARKALSIIEHFSKK